MNTDSLRYAGFWPRLGSFLLDAVIMLPVAAVVAWGESINRLFDVYYLVPGILFALFYNVYLVRHYGGTPGKLIVRIRIRKLDGEPVGYYEAFLRYWPDFIFTVLISVTLLFPLFQISDEKYFLLTFTERREYIVESAPSWLKSVQVTGAIWGWGELIVLLTNRKRRALHDFIAGTVVVHDLPETEPEPAPLPPAIPL
jgi:uncharacterized RDD family membrane protein YckC